MDNNLERSYKKTAMGKISWFTKPFFAIIIAFPKILEIAIHNIAISIVIVGMILIGLLLIPLYNIFSGKTQLPDIVFNLERISLQRDMNQKPYSIIIDDIAKIDIKKGNDKITIHMKDGSTHKAFLSGFTQRDKKEIKQIFEEIGKTSMVLNVHKGEMSL